MLSRLTFSAATALFLTLPVAVSAEGHTNADTIVATVNGTEITLGHMIVLKQRLPTQYQQLPPNVLFDGILDQLVQQTLLGETLDALSKGGKLTLDNEARALKAAEVIQTFAAEATSEDALQAAYEAEFGGADTETEYNASHILVETEEEAQALVTELEGGADFGELATEKSTGPSGPNGGQLGWFGVGAMVPEFEQAVVAMEPETISAPVQTQFGWHVIRLNETRVKEAPALEEVRAELTDQVQREAIEAYITELTKGANVARSTADEVDPALLDDLSLLQE
jgi:peptidyl-prolyl cis-trans isomerase C